MKRVRQHVIEEESRKEFANILPNEWVCNDFHKDYGKDIHVEIFKDNVATGKTFIVQLKGTDQEPLHGIVAIAIKIDTLRYYATIQNAVLLVFYNTRQKSFKAIWANHLIHTINITPKQKVTYVKLNGQHSVDKPYFKKLENSFSPQHPSKQNLCFTSDTPIGKLFSKRIMKWIEKYYPNSYEIADFTLPFRYETKFIETQNAIVPTVQINEDPILELDPIIKKDLLPFLISPLIDINAINNEEAELLFLVSSRFVQFNPEASYLFLKQLIIKYTGRYKNQNTLAQIAQFAIENRLINDLQTLIEISIENSLFTEFQYLNMSLATVDNVDNLNLYEKNLLKAIGKFSKNTLKATCYYNVASLYRNQSKHKLALTYYNKALKHNPEYRSKPYIYRELGGVLFLLQKERFAERYYRTSISMADGNEYKLAYALLGDCILWQGRYREASEYYGKYLDSIKTNAILLSIYQHLYTMCLDFMEMGYENNILNCALSNAILNEDLENEDEILTAIEAYPLNIKAWALLGELKAKDKDYNQACCAFKNAAILSNDKLLWFNWLISAHFAGLHLYGLSIFQSMIPTHGLSILNDLSEFVANQLSISIEDKAKFLEEYYSIGNSIQTSFSPSELNLPPKLEIRNWNEKYS